MPKPKRVFKAREQVWVYVGKERLKCMVVAALDAELHPDVYRVQAEDGSFIDTHRKQMATYKGPARVFCAIFEAPTRTPEGLSLPRSTMEDAVALGNVGCKILGVVEYQEVKRWSLTDIPPIPEFLKKSGEDTKQ